MRSVGNGPMASILRSVVRKDVGWKAGLGRWIEWKQRRDDEMKRIKFFPENLGKDMELQKPGAVGV